MQVISIQSHVVYGHVGNSAAVFALQRLGCEVWPIHTVQFSNHTGYDGFTGRVFDAAMIRELFDGLAARGVLATCDGAISGYVGSADIGAAILTGVARMKAENAEARCCCDPVMGDVGRGLFVGPEVVEFMREHAVRAADVVTPNHFELDRLTGRDTRTLESACRAIDALHALGPKVVLVTSLQVEDTPVDAVDLLASDGAQYFRLRTPRLAVAANGAGDLIAALFFGHLIRTGSVANALSRSASAVYGLLARTARSGADEILLIEAQDEIVDPGTLFPVEALAGH
jgi:pyridoxine kinase